MLESACVAASAGVTVSIISHGHGQMVRNLIDRLLGFPEVRQILLTLNIPELLQLPESAILTVIDNEMPAGFGANHNQAFSRSTQPYFCVLNPDVELPENPFPFLIAEIDRHDAAIAAPLVRNPAGGIEDSIRHFPTPFALLRKAISGFDGSYAIEPGSESFPPDWVAGMFMLVRRADYAALEGFDEGFFLYYEDVDLCTRAWKSGRRVLACPAISIVHDARRESRRSRRYLRWHLSSMLRYFVKHLGRLPTTGKRR